MFCAPDGPPGCDSLADPTVSRKAPTMQVTASDGVDLAVNETGPSDAATIVCVHGYPDNSSAWDGVVAELSRRYHVVTYDIRGAGRSGKPAEWQAYRLDQLAADLRAVVDAVSPDRAVHLLAHDWGSIQSWHAVTGEQLADRVASYTSVSGPSLDHTAYWMRSALRPGGARLRDVARQLAESAYIVLFTVPVLPEWLWRKGVLDRGLAAASMIGRDPAPAGDGGPPARTLSDKINGLQLYRANMPHRLRRPQPRPTDVPVQVLAPTRDVFVSPALQTGAPAPWASDLRVREIAGGHWVIGTRPDVIARCTSELIERVESGAVDPAADRSYER
jgi:pimeloyl-ACP methyl ester carboxylesterase